MSARARRESSGRDRPVDRSEWLVLLAILVGAALLRLRFLDVPLERDEGEYATMAQLLLAGGVPYVDAHNMKLPGVYYAYAAILGALGATPQAVRAGLLAVNLASIVLVHLLARKLFDAATGLVAAAAFTVLSLDDSMLGFTANAEHFVVVAMLAGVLLLGRFPERRALSSIAAAGALLGVAVLMKQHGAAFAAFGGVWLLVEGAPWRDGSWARTAREEAVFAAAVLAPLAATAAAMAALGAFEPFVFWTFTYAREYAGLIPVAAGLAELRAKVRAIAASSSPLWLLAAIGASALAWDGEARRRARFLALFAAFSFAAVLPGMRFTDHYFLFVVPAASLLAAVGVASLARRARHLAPRADRSVLAGLSLAAVALSLWQERALLAAPSPAAVSRAVYGSDPFPEAVEIARYLRAHAAPGDRLAVIGSEPEIYFLSGLRAATSFLYVYPLMERQPFARRMQEEMIEQIERERPRFLVMVNVDNSWTRLPDSPSRLFEWSARFANDHYEPVGLAEIEPGRETVYRWDGAARDAAPRTRAFVTVLRRRDGGRSG